MPYARHYERRAAGPTNAATVGSHCSPRAENEAAQRVSERRIIGRRHATRNTGTREETCRKDYTVPRSREFLLLYILMNIAEDALRCR